VNDESHHVGNDFAKGTVEEKWTGHPPIIYQVLSKPSRVGTLGERRKKIMSKKELRIMKGLNLMFCESCVAYTFGVYDHKVGEFNSCTYCGAGLGFRSVPIRVRFACCECNDESQIVEMQSHEVSPETHLTGCGFCQNAEVTLVAVSQQLDLTGVEFPFLPPYGRNASEVER